MSRTIALAYTTTILISSATALASGTYYDLGTNRNATGVSADGSVVAGTISTPQFSPYWMWTLDTPGITTLIGGVSPGSGVGGTAKVSDDGDKISGTVDGFVPPPPFPATIVRQAGVYDVSAGAWTGVGGIGWYSGTETSGGWCMSGDGNVLGGLGWSPNQITAYAITSTNLGTWNSWGACVQLPWEVPGRSTRINGLNYDGSVGAGWQDRVDGFRQAAVWIDGDIQRLWKSYPNQPLSEAQACSADGTWVIGNGTTIPGNGHAWRWSEATGYQSLGAPTPPQERGFATGISADGSVIVGFNRTNPPNPNIPVGFIWTAAGGMQDLTTYVTSHGVTLPPGVTLILPANISADGLTIVGTASDLHGFVVRLDPPVCPADIDGNDSVDVTDLLAVINTWGACANPKDCPADIDGNDTVDVIDLLAVINAWGACP